MIVEVNLAMKPQIRKAITMNFKSLGIKPEMVQTLKKMGITEPTPIQAKSIPPIINGKDLIASAQTGTGKTLAFLLPIIEKISPKSPHVQALILSPTRELALQITEVANQLAHAYNLGVLAVYGGQDTTKQIKKLDKGVQIVIATPGRLLDHMGRNSIDLKQTKFFVLDEADQMLLMGFKNEVEMVVKALPKKRQTLCFSATLDASVKKIAYRYTKSPLTVAIEKEKPTLEAIRQEVVETTDRHKEEALLSVLNEDNPYMAIIFCRTKRRVEMLYTSMADKGYNCMRLHSDILQSKRERMMKSFRSGDVQYLIATDVAARGIDVDGITHVYNYDAPETPESYIHRIGRTGRAGETGYTCLFVAPKNAEELAAIESKLKRTLPRRSISASK